MVFFNYLIIAIIGGAFAAFIGAWVNNVFTWKIKNRIEALDAIYIDILEFNQAFLEFCKKNQNNTTIDNDSVEVMNQKVTPYINRVYLNCFIVDEIKVGKLYKKMYAWHEEIKKNANNYFDVEKNKWNIPKPQLFILNVNTNEQPSDVVKEYQNSLNNVTEDIFAYRKEITSFSYMLKQLNPYKAICNLVRK